MDVEEGKLEEALVDKPRTTIGTKFLKGGHDAHDVRDGK